MPPKENNDNIMYSIVCQCTHCNKIWYTNIGTHDNLLLQNGEDILFAITSEVFVKQCEECQNNATIILSICSEEQAKNIIKNILDNEKISADVQDATDSTTEEDMNVENSPYQILEESIFRLLDSDRMKSDIISELLKITK